jgi:hypothetical protein
VILRRCAAPNQLFPVDLEVSYTVVQFKAMEDVDWTYRADYVRDRHDIEAEWANEALRDPDALRIAPDPSSKSGRSVRTIGFSPSAGGVLTVITLGEDDVTYGVNAWRSNDTDIKRYGEGS